MSITKKYSFNSGGNSISQQNKKIEQEISVLTTYKPLGIKTPLTLSKSDDIFSMNYSLFSQIEDNFKNLIKTNSGERLCFPNLGTNIRSILSNTNIDNPQDLVMEEIQKVASVYMPYINLTTFSSVIDEEESKKNNSVITLNIGFTVPSVSNEQKIIKIKLGMAN